MKPPAISAIQEIELNIAPGTEIDPWPRYGLVAKYKPFILNRVKPFLQNNGHLNRNEVITDVKELQGLGREDVRLLFILL
jgi:hypothetical protein